MWLSHSSRHRWGPIGIVFASLISVNPTSAANIPRSNYEYSPSGDPFAVLDPQKWVNPDNMTWADWKTPPGTNWSDPTKTGSNRNFRIALVTVDYPDKPFTITLPAHSTVFNNPQPAGADLNLTREDVPTFYRDFLNKPGELNKGHTLHEYWSEYSLVVSLLTLHTLTNYVLSGRLDGPLRCGS